MLFRVFIIYLNKLYAGMESSGKTLESRMALQQASSPKVVGNALYEIQSGLILSQIPNSQPDGSRVIEYLVQRKLVPQFAYLRQKRDGPLIRWDAPIYGSEDELKKKFPYMFSKIMEEKKGEQK